MRTVNKTLSLLIAAFIFLTFFSIRACNDQEQLNAAHDRYERQADSLMARQRTIIQQMTDSLESVNDTIEKIRSESMTEVVTRFVKIYGEPDTIYQPTYLIDSSQLVACNECDTRLDSNRVAVHFMGEALDIADSVRIVLSLRADNYQESDSLWREHYELPWWRCRAKRKRIRKINTLAEEREKGW